MIRLNCFFASKEGRYNEALEAALRLTAASQLQEGCISYDVFESDTRDNVFMFCETWVSQEALDKHSSSEVFVKEVAAIQDCGHLKLERFEF